MKRRDFLVHGAALAAGAALPRLADAWPLPHAGTTTGDGGWAGSVAIIRDPADAVAGSAPARWAVEELRKAFVARGVQARILPGVAEASAAEACIVVAGPTSAMGRASGIAAPAEPESLALGGGRLGDRPVSFALGSDARGLVYAVTELADVVALAGPAPALSAPASPHIGRPANRVRSVIRLFTSDVEDKPWFNDREFWRQYFAMLVAQRFNRVNLSFGLGYDQPQQLKDTYFYFAYPFLVKVPGYDVRATNLPDAERDRNLEMLRFISDEAAAHGLDFQLGLWTHAYQWQDSPNVNHVIEGLTPATQATYCRDALSLLLRECPNVTGVTLRIHGESGVPEGSYGLWQTIFSGVKVGRPVSLDLHAKGIDEPTLAAALAVGVPVTISPKFWAEHMGLPYHQADIRPTEVPVGRQGSGMFAHSEGDRSFTRYGYADLLREDRRYDVLHRIWPGTQRVLLWSDPAFAAAYGRTAHIAGSAGAEVFDPLSFKGRKGSGLPGGRDGYADLSFRAPGPDFEKYRLTYATWGRGLYDPDAAPDARSRLLVAEYGPAGEAAGAALASASRILPLLTSAHTPSAANNHFWPEMYVNMAIADPTAPVMPYPDTPVPRRFGTVSPLDPQVFSRIEDFAGELLANRPGGKYSPAEVARWLENLAAGAETALAEARRHAGTGSPAFRRMDVDTGVQIGMGRFFAWKLRAGVLYALFARTGNAAFQTAAVDAYRHARAAYARVAEITTGVYVKDMTYGPEWYQRGHWSDRLAAIDRDIAAVARGDTAGVGPNAAVERTGGAVGAAVRAAAQAPVVPVSAARARDLIASVLHPVERPTPDLRHQPPHAFKRGQPVHLELTLTKARKRVPGVLLHYRRLTQAERWQTLAMPGDGRRHTATIPAEYAASPYPLEYYFEVTEPSGPAWLYPALAPDLASQPYFVVNGE